MRRAADLWAKYSDDIQGWLIRESGGTRAKTARELSDAVDECLEACALPSHAVGEVLPSKNAPLEAGLPAGVLHVLPGGADVGYAMVTDANVQAVSFTGSTKAGQSVGEHLLHPFNDERLPGQVAKRRHSIAADTGRRRGPAASEQVRLPSRSGGSGRGSCGPAGESPRLGRCGGTPGPGSQPEPGTRACCR